MEHNIILQNFSKLEQNKQVIFSTLDFFIKNKVDIDVYNADNQIVKTLKSVSSIVLGEALSSQLAKNMNGDMLDFCYIKISDNNDSSTISIDNHLLKEWAYKTANETNEKPKVIEQISKDGDLLVYIRHNGVVSDFSKNT